MHTSYFVVAKKNLNRHFIGLLFLGFVLMFVPLKGFAATEDPADPVSCPGVRILKYLKNMVVEVDLPGSCASLKDESSDFSKAARDALKKQAQEDYDKYSANVGMKDGYNPYDFDNNSCESGCLTERFPDPPTLKLVEISCMDYILTRARIKAIYEIDLVKVTCVLQTVSTGARGTKAASTRGGKPAVTGVGKKAATMKSGSTVAVTNGQTPAAVALSNRLAKFCGDKKRATDSSRLSGPIVSLCRVAASKTPTIPQRAQSVETFCTIVVAKAAGKSSLAGAKNIGISVKKLCAGVTASTLTTTGTSAKKQNGAKAQTPTTQPTPATPSSAPPTSQTPAPTSQTPSEQPPAFIQSMAIDSYGRTVVVTTCNPGYQATCLSSRQPACVTEDPSRSDALAPACSPPTVCRGGTENRVSCD